MSVYKRGGKWYITFYVNGVRYYFSTGTSNRREAERIAQKLKEEVNLRLYNLPQLNTAMTLNELYIEIAAKLGLKPHHVDRAKQLLPYFGEMPIGSITRNTVAEYRLYRHRQKEVSDATINRDLQCLRTFLYWAVYEGILPANPLSRVPLVRERRKGRPVMTLTEEGLLLTSAAPHLRPIIVIALDTGMRRGEILQQRFEDIDWERKLLFVSRSKTPEGEAREIPLTGRVFELLWNIRENEGLICTFHGNAIKRIKTAWRTSLRRSGIRHFRFHDLRHTFNCRLMEAGVMQEVRKSLMGHSSGEDVHARYTHVELPLKREAIKRLETWVATRTQEIESPQISYERSESNGNDLQTRRNV